ncbi:LysE family translocator [Novosphingobium sediminicola]|uniref:Threonine/homoserine/homoserine lactone efflux protein n=1 Tax=Novosphingobium sediminicola TaxID=563162 RepID=A0A7W6CCI7_9SPHN|nr:LysE family translocator [Novosphingobium sediminicola]MBB3954031.1 threonine/homoserine/homoserine lactone efflux protein [Novosphingobium sediminicola]
MVHLPLFLAFVAAAALLTITPGLDTVMVLRTASVEGRRPAAMAGAGIAVGCLIWGGAVSLGLGALLQASQMAYTAVKMAGAAYLLWLGVKLLIHPRKALEMNADGPPQSEQDAFRRGFLTNLLNPKMGVFYITFLPQFVPAGVSVAAYTFFLAGVHVLLAFIWFALLIAATVPLSGFLRRPGAVPVLDRLTGGLFVAFGLRLATSTSR